MKNIFIVIILFIFTNSSLAAPPSHFHGPTYECHLKNISYFPSYIILYVYSTSTFDVFSPTILVSYHYDHEYLDDYEKVNFIAELKSSGEESTIYKGKITNLDYLVDVEMFFDGKNSHMSLLDKGKKYDFRGICKIVMIPKPPSST